ncbi:MAG: DUF4147 domain-containing protein [Patescibacteria group bacterium]
MLKLKEMLIDNFKNLAKNSLRQKALLIAEAGYEAIEIERVVSERIKLENNYLELTIQRDSMEKNFKINLNNFKRVFLVGVGKGSALASISLVKILGDKLTGGIALDINKPTTNNQQLTTFIGTHPFPSKQNITATQKIIELVKNLNKDDLLITFICGGGSALLCGSEKELKDSVLATKLLTQAGADILELNTVRKHLSEIKGGGLAKLAYPATIVSLVVSDVLGNNLSMVASGPTVFDKTTNNDAKNIFKKYSLEHKNFHFHENPKEKKYFKKVKNILFLSNREPLLAMAEKAQKLGFKPKIYSYSLRGEAKNALLPLSSALPYREVPKTILAGGETTVVLNKELRIMNDELGRGYELGKGGRNMEAVLGAVNSMHNSLFTLHNSIIMSFASDGHDNTKAAGAIADFSTIQKAKKLKLNPEDFLKNHNSFNFFKKTNDLIFTEQKTFNVADLMFVLSAPKE